MHTHGNAARPSFAHGTSLAKLLLRISLGVGLLSAVADRFGLWGPAGKPTVAWGTFANFLAYTTKLNPWVPIRLVPALGWAVTLTEVLLGIALLAGFRLRITAAGAAILTTVFGIAMAISIGVQAPLNYSVFAFAAGAYLLATLSDR